MTCIHFFIKVILHDMIHSIRFFDMHLFSQRDAQHIEHVYKK